MKPFFASIGFVVWSLSALAVEINVTDIGTFELMDVNMKPTGFFYRLSLDKEGNWAMDGKKPGQKWENISFNPGCEYRRTTIEEMQAYFPQSWLTNADVACIQNIAQAFCRFSPKNEPTRIHHLVIALVTEKPSPLFLRRALQR